MNNTPISQPPEPYCAILDILRSPSDLDTLLKNVLENAINIVDANWGMIVLSSYSLCSSYHSSTVRILPDMRPQTLGESGVSLFLYSLACEAMQQEQGRIIPNVALIPTVEKQDVMKKHLPPWMLESSGQSAHAEEALSLIITPIFTDQDETGVVVVGRPASEKPFDPQHLADIENLITFISRYVNVSVALDRLASKNDQFLRMMTFEIRSPLTMIRGYTNLLLEFSETEKTTDRQINFLQNIKKGAERIARTFYQFMDLTELESGKIRLEKTKTNIREAVDAQIEHLKPILEDRGQKVILDIINEITLNADRNKINRVIQALITNASTYSPHNNEIKVNIERQGNLVRISVSDNGVGLTDEDKEHLFQPFYRSARTKVREHVGMGVELFISKHYIEKLGGQIGADSIENQGSTFWFTLPLEE